jgi:hypothetical protein
MMDGSMIELSSRVLLMRRTLFSLIVLASASIGGEAAAQVQPDPRGRPPWADTTGESGVYPIGDAVGVYRAVLDLLFVDGAERPRIIVMHDTAEGRGGGPCPIACDRKWPHKSKIDTATVLAFARLSPKRPKIIPFGYPIPIAFLSYEGYGRLRDSMNLRLRRAGRTSYEEEPEFSAEFAKTYPGTWGKLTLSKVGFNKPHTEALVQASLWCGDQCHSDEILFLRRIAGRWTIAERIPNDAEGAQAWAGMRYRGPAGDNPAASEIVLAPAGANARRASESGDAAAVYRTVFDSLYSFHGQSPRRIVVSNWFPVDPTPLTAHKQPIDPETLTRYVFLRSVRPPLDANVGYRLPVTVLARDSIQALERLGGGALERQATENGEWESSFWLAFRQRFPGAWGMLGYTRVAFNTGRTQALVFTNHACGESCRNTDTWLLERRGEKWRIVERIPLAKQTDWHLDPLRYLGVDANPKTYRPRRIHGRFVAAQSGRPLRQLAVMVKRGQRSYRMVTDQAGRYSVDSLPLSGPVEFRIDCPNPPQRKSMLVGGTLAHAGLDTTIDVTIDFGRCLPDRPARALAGPIDVWSDARRSTYPDAEAAAVYRGVLDSLYPANGSHKGPILLHPITSSFAEFPFEDAFVALRMGEEMPRLERQGVLDASMEKNIEKLPKDSAWLRPTFAYSRPVIVLQPSQKRFLYAQGEDFREVQTKRDIGLTTLAKQAYPGADAILSFSRVAFNDGHTQAVVQVSAGDDPRFAHWGDIMALHKSGNDWRVVRRHVESGKTSGERVGDQCLPTDAPTTTPTVEQLRTLVGYADITVNPTTNDMRPFSGSSRYAFMPIDNRPQLKNAAPSLATVQFIDSLGKLHKKPIGLLDFTGHVTLFYEGPPQPKDQLDGGSSSTEVFTILRVSGREFFGIWSSTPDGAMPFVGYFCGRLR